MVDETKPAVKKKAATKPAAEKKAAAKPAAKKETKPAAKKTTAEKKPATEKKAAAKPAAEKKKAAPKETKTWHVTFDEKKNKWCIKARENGRDTASFNTKEEALARAKELKKNNEGSNIVVHKKDGKFQKI